MSIIKWLIFLPVLLAAKAITAICAPVAALLSMRGDSLPRWLLWMQTHDNPIDALWQQPRHMAGYTTLRGVDPAWCRESPLLRWYCRMLWLIRNPAYGLADVLGYESHGHPGEVIARRGTWDDGNTNWKVTVWDGAWQVQAQLFYPFLSGRFLRVYIGWKSVSGLQRLMFASHINPFRQWR